MAGDSQTAVSFARGRGGGQAAAADLHLERSKEAAHTSKDTANKTKRSGLNVAQWVLTWSERRLLTHHVDKAVVVTMLSAQSVTTLGSSQVHLSHIT